MNDDIYLELVKAVQEHQQVCLCVLVETSGSVPLPAGGKMLVFSDGKTIGSVGGGLIESKVTEEALAAIKTGKPRLLAYSLEANVEGSVGLCGGFSRVYLEPQMGKPTLLILGGGHVGLALAKIASKMDFKIIICDDREVDLAPLGLADRVEFILCDMAELPKRVHIGSSTFIVGLSRDSQLDIDGFPSLLETDFAYFGAIGSRKRWAHAREKIIEAGVPAEKVDMIKSPIGLHIHAVTPDEIAISILAEIIQTMHKKQE